MSCNTFHLFLVPPWQIWFRFLPLTVFSLHSFFQNKFYFCLHFHCLLHSIHSLYRLHFFMFSSHISFWLLPPLQIAFHLLPSLLITFDMQFPSQFSFHFQLSITDLFLPAAFITHYILFWSFHHILYFLCLTIYFICFFDLNDHFIWTPLTYFLLSLRMPLKFKLPHRFQFHNCPNHKKITTADPSTQQESCLGLCVTVCLGSTCLFWFCSRRIFGFALQYWVPTCVLLG